MTNANVPSAPVDVKVRYAQAKKLLDEGHLDEATDELAWLWQHMLEHDLAMVGVRLSFMAGLMTTLAAKHAPARERFAGLRDALEPVVDADAASWMQLQDWAVLCKVLAESDRAVAWFDRQGKSYDPTSRSARVMENQLVPLLRARGRWADLGRLYSDPLEAVRQHHRMLENLPRVTAQQPANAAEVGRSITEHVLSAVAVVHAALRAAERNAEAESVREELRRLLPGEALEAALASALKEAGVHERP